MGRLFGSKNRSTQRLEAIIDRVAGDDMRAREMLARSFAYTAKKPPIFWKKVATIAEEILAQIDGEDVAYVVRLQGFGDGRGIAVSSAQATCMIASGDCRLATRAEILDLHAEERARGVTVEAVASATAPISKAADGGAK